MMLSTGLQTRTRNPLRTGIRKTSARSEVFGMCRLENREHPGAPRCIGVVFEGPKSFDADFGASSRCHLLADGGQPRPDNLSPRGGLFRKRMPSLESCAVRRALGRHRVFAAPHVSRNYA